MTQSRRRPVRRGRRFGGARRAFEWADELLDFTLASGGQNTVTLMPGVPDDEFKGLTVARLIIDLSAVLIAAGTGGMLGLGIMVVTLEALVALAVPDADEAGDQAGWMWRSMQPVHTDSPNDRAQATRFVADIRSMRKLPGEGSAP